MADVVSIGSYSGKFSTWKWAWSNPSVDPALREAALPLKQLQAITGFDLFGDDQAFAIQDEKHGLGTDRRSGSSPPGARVLSGAVRSRWADDLPGDHVDTDGSMTQDTAWGG
ncbi:hypothetical protein PSH85_14305 [Pseudomonas simiae]|uniref:DUF6882 domain-containing protein n=1 Tax=Pseudomonas simiae TaxID=321846 RepID=UPI00273634CF|nr:DUF6882 domain-containing protein [Pseudomonas simiae]WLI21560.1 hypothetical protein PSH85_14305 [Pseudomonas simiae]